MPKESFQKKLSRVRTPRVHITYEVEIGDALESREIPFVVGVLADLSGMSEEPLPPLKDRRFVEIDRDNFDQVVANCAPRVALKVENTLSKDDTLLGVDLRFKSMEDFGPVAIANQIPELRKLLAARNALHNLRICMAGNSKLESIIKALIADTPGLERISTESGATAWREQNPERRSRHA
jgi:type VI secretion system protein ImpB